MEPQQGKYKIIAIKDWVPQKFGLVMFILFGFIFQFSMSAYLNNLEDMRMATQLNIEDIKLAFQVSLIGMACVFPMLFRIKFRFKSKHILLLSITMVMICAFIASHTHNIVILLLASFILGIFRMVGTFESLSTIQLMITPKRDMGIWFTFVYMLVLLSIQGSGLVAVNLGFHMGYESMYHLMLGVHIIMLILVAVIMRPIHFMDPVPFKGIDFRGAGLWALLFIGMSYIFIYGQTKDWFNSSEIIYATIFSIIILGILIYSYSAVPMPYIGAKVFTLRSIVTSSIIILLLEFFINTGGGIIHPFEEGLMDLDSLHLVQLNWAVIAGIILGAVFCFIWFKDENRKYKVLFFTGFTTLMLYHLLMKRILTPDASFNHLLLPYFFKGIGYVIIYAGVGKYMMKDVTFETFPQGWFVIAIVRNAVGAPIVSQLISEWHHHKTLYFLEKLATQMQIKKDVISGMAQQIRFGTIMSGQSAEVAEQPVGGTLYGKVYLQSMTLAAQDIYRWITVFGVAILIGILLHHFYKPFRKYYGDRFWKA